MWLSPYVLWVIYSVWGTSCFNSFTENLSFENLAWQPWSLFPFILWKGTTLFNKQLPNPQKKDSQMGFETHEGEWIIFWERVNLFFVWTSPLTFHGCVCMHRGLCLVVDIEFQGVWSQYTDLPPRHITLSMQLAILTDVLY